MQHTIFHDIVEGKAPCYAIHEDEHFLAFLDIFPRGMGHTLVIPKEYARWVYDVPNFAAYWEFTLATTQKIQKALQPRFISYITHGLEVPYAHIHIIPRFQETSLVPPVQKVSKKELEEIAEKIKKI